MPAYRFYNLTLADPEEAINAAFFSDGAAMTWAFRRAGPGGIEVWQETRFVGRLHGADRAGPDQNRVGED